MRVPGHQRSSYAWRWTAALAGLAVLALALVMAVVVSPAGRVEADTFTVNSTDDDPDINVGDGNCDVDGGTSGEQCTLRAALEEANFTSGVADTISFSITGAGPHTIIVTVAEGALPAITDDHLTINGGSEVVIIKPEAGAAWDPLLAIDADDVSISNLILDGDNQSMTGIIIVTNNDEATISDVEITDLAGVGIAADGNNDDNVVDDVFIHDNTLGGMLVNSGSDDNIIRNSNIEDNATIGGDGIYLLSGSGNQVSNNTIEDNGTGGGDDGITAVSQAELTISGNTISDNADNQISVSGSGTGVVTIRNNIIDVDSDGIELDLGCACGDVVISGSSNAEANRFSGPVDGVTEFYLENESGEEVDATHNDWAGDSDPEDKICGTDGADDTTDCDENVVAGSDVDWDPVAPVGSGGPPTPTPTPVSRGDVNCDTVIDAVDALFVLQCVVGLRSCEFQCPGS